jgi:hypothetical protein
MGKGLMAEKPKGRAVGWGCGRVGRGQGRISWGCPAGSLIYQATVELHKLCNFRRDDLRLRPWKAEIGLACAWRRRYG